MNRQAALEYVRSLAIEDLVSFINEAVQPLSTGDLSTGLRKYVLAECFHYRDQATSFTHPPVVDLVALPAGPEYLGSDHLGQSGNCHACHAEVCCSSKEAKCPLCEATVSCT